MNFGSFFLLYNISIRTYLENQAMDRFEMYESQNVQNVILYSPFLFFCFSFPDPYPQ